MGQDVDLYVSIDHKNLFFEILLNFAKKNKLINSKNYFTEYSSHYRFGSQIANFLFYYSEPINVKFDNRSYFSTVIGLAFRKLDVFGYFKFVTAVKNINLLPNRDNMIAQKKAKVFSNFAFKGVIGGLSIIYIVLFGLSFWNIKTYNDKLVDYDEVITAHELKTLENKKVQKDIAFIVRALDISKNIKSNKVINFRVLAQIASAVPKRVKFNSIEYDGSSQIVIEGGAFSDQDILKLISNLNNKKLIAQASLATMTLPEGNQQGKQAMKGFKVVCVLESI